MCTAVTYKTRDHYFGRTFDWVESYGERLVITPRKYTIEFRRMPAIKSHYAIIGMAVVAEEFPLYYDGTNEKGLSMAGLNFPGNADYKQENETKENIAPFELIPWILSQCKNVDEAKELLNKINIVNIGFNEKYNLSPLHWIVSDREKSITVEAVREGVKIYDNPVGVLTNNPKFPMQMFNLNNYKGLTNKMPVNTFSEKISLENYSYGMGGIGLPGDASSLSRFVRASFIKLNSVSEESEEESVGQFFHILEAAGQIRGCVLTDEQKFEITIYTSCCNTDKGIYYYTTYGNRQITGVDMHRENLDSEELIIYELQNRQQIYFANGFNSGE